MTTPDSDWRLFIPDAAGTPFPLLAAPPTLPGLWDLATDDEAARYWLALLRNNAAYLKELAAELGQTDLEPRTARALAIFSGLLSELERGPARSTLRTVHAITLVRDHLLRSFGLMDAYAAVKSRECAQYLQMSRDAMARSWAWGAAPSAERLATILTDLLTGNLFDLGSAATQQAFRRGTLDYDSARQTFRAAVVDWIARQPDACHRMLRGAERPLDGAPAGRVLFFADNSGRDFLLGVLPAAMFWARRWEVCVVVNSLPVSSDVAIDEARALFSAQQSGAGADAFTRALGAERLRLIESGTGSPGIDLSHVGPELNAAARSAAWIVIEGQGRAVETNWTTRFTCPVLRAAVAKDPFVARAIGVAPGAPVLRWDADGARNADFE